MNQALHDEISKVAFDLYQKEGCPQGRHLTHWFEAEKIVKERYESDRGETADPETPPGTRAARNRPGSGRKKKSLKRDATPA